MYSQACLIDSGPWVRTIFSRVGPSTYSMAMKWVPLASSASNRMTTFGWLSWAMARASRWKRERISGRAASTCGRITLRATTRSSFGWMALNTIPIPPSPSGAWTRYEPMISFSPLPESSWACW